MVAFVLLASGCQSSEPLVPREIYQQVNDDGREWTYDTAWQNIRKLNADLESGELSTVADDALLITSQMERLTTGRATALNRSWATALVEKVSEETETRSLELNIREARLMALRLQDTFDAGDFTSAQEAALEVHVITRDMDLGG